MEQARHTLPRWLPLLLVGLAALLPRSAGLADFLTHDEAYHWIARTERFSTAITRGNWADTVQTGHPGVTLMWAGSAGLWLERVAVAAGWPAPANPLEHLAWLRLVPALLQVLWIMLGYLLLRQLLGARLALISALLWGFSPYLIAHGRLLHLDGLLTGTATLCLLLLLRATHHTTGRTAIMPLLASAVCAGLALLTKGPALILLPFVGVALLVLQLAAGRPGRDLRRWLGITRQVIASYMIWLATALLVVLVLWPALWVDPGRAMQAYLGEIISNGGRPNGDGQFFMGQAIGDPGWLFYPAANLFRATPVLLLGLLLALPALRSNSYGPDRRVLLVLLACVAFWTLVMTLGPKKFDRYVLPSWPALCVLAAPGLDWLLRTIRQRVGRRPALAGAALLLAAEISQPLTYHPYYLSYYNPLFGGGATAQRMFLIGWGEGMDAVGAYLRSRRDINGGPVLSAVGPTLQPFLPVTVRPITDFGRVPANYAVAYLESQQRGAFPEVYAAIQQTEPLHRIIVHDIEYARIYQLPRPYDEPVGALFADALHLAGVSVQHEPDRLIITPAWDVRATPGGEYTLFLHLVDAGGTRVAQIDIAPGGGDAPPTSAWQPGEQIAVPLPLALPADLPPGSYRIVVGLYDTSGTRVPFGGGTPADPAIAGDRALLLTTLVFE
ncbi:MAG TPA: phospholipid carrier-dependent glycosyltransferase [Roseiflexaceae bacterium]|nr:phospholipid carrier-dependent glycosyltransferase [Roseiflexaceae bacterium]